MGRLPIDQEAFVNVNKLYCIVLSLVVLIAPYAQAKTCFMTSCNYITDGAFVYGGTYWNESSTVTYPTIANDCKTSKLAELWNTDYIEQSFYVDNGYSNGFTLEFHAYLIDDTDNWYDQLTIRVTNTDTNVTETFYMRGSSYNTQCGTQVLNLSNDYSLHNVKVRFEVSYLSIGKWQLDDVAFWGHG